MKVESLIPTFWFCKEENEKNKLNWFTYELACKIYEALDRSRKKSVIVWKNRKSDKQVAEFCAYFAKRMKRSILDRANGLTSEVRIEEAFIRDLYHTISRRDSNAILEIAANSYHELLKNCAVCPVRCIEEMYMYCKFFDQK